MTITEAIEQLQALKKQHGDIKVYFDCPFCERSYEPNQVKPVAVHVSSQKAYGGKAEKS